VTARGKRRRRKGRESKGPQRNCVLGLHPQDDEHTNQEEKKKKVQVRMSGGTIVNKSALEGGESSHHQSRLSERRVRENLMNAEKVGRRGGKAAGIHRERVGWREEEDRQKEKEGRGMVEEK